MEKISRTFSVPMDWLLYGKGEAVGLDQGILSSKEEVTMYFPVTISGQSLVDEMNWALTLVVAESHCHAELTVLQREHMESIVQKYNLYEQYADHAQIIRCANAARKRMISSIEKYRCGYL